MSGALLSRASLGRVSLSELPADLADVWERLSGLGWRLDQFELLAPPTQGARNPVRFARYAGKTVVIRLPRVAAKVSGKTSARHARERHHQAAAAEAGVTPTPLLADPADGLLVLPFVPGQHPEPGKLDPAAAARMGRCLGKLHRETAPFDQGTDILRRIRRRVAQVATDAAAARRHAAGLPTIARALEPMLATLERTAPPLAPCHGDLVPGNIIDDGNRVYLIDWETSTAGDPHQDIANVCLRTRLQGAARATFLETCFDGHAVAELEQARARVQLWEAACALDKALIYWRNGMRSGEIDPRVNGWTRRCSRLLAAPGTRAAALVLDNLAAASMQSLD
ncbi:MAG: phosphotransferase [Lamprobacter sp.]|uniref:phosphotransferase n=1 Tax=Lamprobacter sp. TaxID=3100796 RepID=UPI002B25C5FE|nr:phosphotransferase [Lamprobacter sp.]MEA3640885.1 phosphotransferase [Lamprobacter sp.]